MARVRKHKRGGKRVRVGAPDPSLTPNGGLAAVTELVDRLAVVEALDAGCVLAPHRPARDRLNGTVATAPAAGITLGAAAELLRSPGAGTSGPGRRETPPVDEHTARLLRAQRGRCPGCGEFLLHAEHEPRNPREWEQWFITVRRVLRKQHIVEQVDG